jgi:hypothetical protein
MDCKEKEGYEKTAVDTLRFLGVLGALNASRGL